MSLVGVATLVVVTGVLGAVPATASVGPLPSLIGTSLGSGLDLNLFGTKLAGGDSSACVNDQSSSTTSLVTNKNADGSASLCNQQQGVFAASEGEGTLLDTSAVGQDQKATETTPGQTSGSTDPTCAQGGSTPSSLPLLVSLGTSCSYAQAGIDSAGNPAATAMGEVANITVGLNGLLSPILGSAAPSATSGGSCTSSGTLGSLLGTVCTALTTVASSAPQPVGSAVSGIDQALQNLLHVVTTDADPTLTIDAGQAKTSSTTDAGTVKSVVQGSSLDIGILPGVGCAAGAGASSLPSLAQCIADPTQYAAPLVEIIVAPALSATSFDGTSWSPTGTGSLVTVDVNIPGFQQVISVPPSTNETILSGTPFQTTISPGSVQTNSAADGAISLVKGTVVDLLESTQFPGGSSGVGALSVDTGSIGSTGTLAGSSPPPVAAANPSATPPPVAAVASSTSPTAVHTGEWWAGSLPLLAVLILAGGGLLAWPRARRWAVLRKLASRAHR